MHYWVVRLRVAGSLRLVRQVHLLQSVLEQRKLVSDYDLHPPDTAAVQLTQPVLQLVLKFEKVFYNNDIITKRTKEGIAL